MSDELDRIRQTSWDAIDALARDRHAELRAHVTEIPALCDDIERLTAENAALRERIAAAIEVEAEAALASYIGGPRPTHLAHATAGMRYAAEIARRTP